MAAESMKVLFAGIVTQVIVGDEVEGVEAAEVAVKGVVVAEEGVVVVEEEGPVKVASEAGVEGPVTVATEAGVEVVVVWVEAEV